MKTSYQISTLTATAGGWIGAFLVAHAIGQFLLAGYQGVEPQMPQVLIQFFVGCTVFAWGRYAYLKALKAEQQAKKESHFKQVA
jgi:hypothetical protein